MLHNILTCNKILLTLSIYGSYHFLFILALFHPSATMDLCFVITYICRFNPVYKEGSCNYLAVHYSLLCLLFDLTTANLKLGFSYKTP